MAEGEAQGTDARGRGGSENGVGATLDFAFRIARAFNSPLEEVFSFNSEDDPN